MTALRPEDFDAFMREVTGFEPFPWQRRLLREVQAQGWPALLDLPTGVGKTSVLLIALFHLAMDPQRGFRRIALVVDRRIIVDQVDGFAQKTLDALNSADPDKAISAKVAERLRALSSDPEAAALHVAHLRGGIPRDDSWIQAPDQPTIIASTVDQVGSRLLFRGYGVSEGMRPIHAGILARDTLYFLDEVHLATAFEETLAQLEDRYAGWAARGEDTGRRFGVVRMSATPGGDPARARFVLDDDDRAHPELEKRLNAPRLASLVQVKTARSKEPDARARNREKLALAACQHARQAVQERGARGIGVVVNRVDTARRIAARLKAMKLGEVLLITGRMRPFERRAVEAELARSVATGVRLDQERRPTFVVATSCIEAGADLDFDALVTEVASLDALRQRFGRFNRLGRHEHTAAWVLGCSDQLGSKAADDPIYGAALRETWAYLEEVASSEGKAKVVDFGLSAFEELEKLEDPARREALLPPRAEAPLLFPSYLDMWSETRPAPYPDPDPALWLHGKREHEERDVQVVFRADVPAPLAEPRGRELEWAREAVEFLPPVAEEAVSVPRRELVDWLGKQGFAWRWTAEGLESVAVETLGVGDTVVVPAGRGGLGSGTWDPAASAAVEDVAEQALFALRGQARLRIDARCLPPALREGLPAPSRSGDPEALEAAREVAGRWLDGLVDLVDLVERAPALGEAGELSASWRALLTAIGESTPEARALTIAEGEEGLVWRVVVEPTQGVALEVSSEDAVSSFTGLEVSLKDHLEDVEAWAGEFARQAGLPEALARDLALAGLLHDLGKADPRFQALLRGGDLIRAAGSGLLAKSQQFGSRSERARAQARSGWPLGLRHELVSLALLDASEALQQKASDLELVRHLVASHHGWCRPWAPTTRDPKPQRVRVEVAGITAEVSTAALDDAFTSACAARFRRLCRRYGWHGLAYLEALLRLGDHRASARPTLRPKKEPS
ncbi:type I-U CRISPR-associated helicase/endonuclease Cas3 [Pseudenhygromyxa sp. WMMC2535]|uniref:type I-G CRISPR-associated helicase/endonuclease Cas3g n=1 Tax=Pseudenhygromyxa sp. WMMC2535 TaxID=2712867 RepID=UPI001552A7F8|nr:type I-U CRISPR-associated helicase/endonuclease Cas3 [Pseudenhygromyxa sp. WMMC2535]NVB39801.1 type I-U CRISPR-associated helicase/endonuclease Cas3 [Pseudenhygromyxa sp. WMMC2535]